MKAFEDKLTQAYRAIYDAQCLVREAAMLGRVGDLKTAIAMAHCDALLGDAIKAVLAEVQA
jgi:hypothetical protein